MSETKLADRADVLSAAAVALRAAKGYNGAQAVACVLAEEVGADPDAVVLSCKIIDGARS